MIGDGAITGGMAYEAMNHAGFLDSNMIVILNDNQQVSLPTQYNNKNQDPVGALSSALARLQVRTGTCRHTIAADNTPVRTACKEAE